MAFERTRLRLMSVLGLNWRAIAPIGALSTGLMKRLLLVAIFALTFVFGACDVWLQDAPRAWNQVFLWSSIVVVSALIFGWVHIDARERQFKKSKWLNIGVLGLSLVFVPVYLVRSRPAGHKLAALAGFVLALAAYFGFGYAGSLLAFQWLG